MALTSGKALAIAIEILQGLNISMSGKSSLKAKTLSSEIPKGSSKRYKAVIRIHKWFNIIFSYKGSFV